MNKQKDSRWVDRQIQDGCREQIDSKKIKGG